MIEQTTNIERILTPVAIVVGQDVYLFIRERYGQRNEFGSISHIPASIRRIKLTSLTLCSNHQDVQF